MKNPTTSKKQDNYFASSMLPKTRSKEGVLLSVSNCKNNSGILEEAILEAKV